MHSIVYVIMEPMEERLHQGIETTLSLEMVHYRIFYQIPRRTRLLVVNAL
jgi:hypothetical protein